MAKNLISDPILTRLVQIWASKIFSWVLSLLYIRGCRKLPSYTISRKIDDSNSIKWRKISFWAWIRPVGLKFELPGFFLKTMAASVTRYYHQLSLCTISKRTNDPILSKFNDRQTGGQKDKKTDGQVIL